MSELLAYLLPQTKEIEVGTATAIIGTVVAYLCGWDDALEALLVFMGIDYVTGIVAAYINPSMTLDSRRGMRGICKKVLVLAVVSLAHFLSHLTGQELIRSVVVFFFLGNEGLSVLENITNAGVPVPQKLQDALAQFKNEKQERNSEKK